VVVTQQAVCMNGFGPDLALPGCQWSSQNTVTSQVWVAWPDTNGIGSALVVDGMTAGGARAVVDRSGTVQLVTSDWSEIRWIALGP
jgi:hypothetical protein